MKTDSHPFRIYRPALTLFLFLCFTVSLGGTAPSLPQDDVIEFVAQDLPAPGSTAIGAQAQRAVLRAFQDHHPNYRIKAFAMPRIGVDAAMDSGPLMAISAGMGPHVIYVNFRQSATYNQQGFLLPMEILLARILSENSQVRETDADERWLADPTDAEIKAAIQQLRLRVPEQVWPVVYREDLTGRSDLNHVWTLPTANLVRALFYRKDHFQEAGLDPERAPETWDELLRYSRILHDPARQRHALTFTPGTSISHSAYHFLVSSGARAMKRNETGDWEAAFAERGAAEGIHFFWRLLREPHERDGVRTVGSASLRPDGLLLWRRGQVSMRFAELNEEMLAIASPHLIGIAPVPANARGERGGELNAEMLGVFSDSSPQQQLAAMRYIWFATGEEAQRIRTETFVNRGFGQFVNPDLLEKFGYTRLLNRTSVGWREAFRESLAHGVPEPYGSNTQFIYRLMSMPINQALERNYHQISDSEAVDDILALLEKAVAEVNSVALGMIPPEEMRKRRMVASLLLALMIGVFSLGVGSIWRSFGRAGPKVDWQKHRSNLLWGWALLIPGFGLIVFWQYIPLAIGGFSITFMDYRVLMDNSWVGVDNFAEILYDPRFWQALWREFYFVALTLGLGFWPPILLAILLQEVPTNFAKYFFRTVFYLPSVLIGIVVMFLWMQLFDPSPAGTLNQALLALNALGPLSATLIKWMLLALWGSLIAVLIWLPIRLEEMPKGLKLCLWSAGAVFTALTFAPLLAAFREGGIPEGLTIVSNLYGRFNLEPLRWLQDPALAMLCIVIPSVWAASGPGCVIYLAGLKSVPDELYEAAAIDGAGFWHRVFYIVLPRLKFLIVLNLIAAVVAAFKGGADQILVMTGGGPNEATTTLSLAIFYRTFMDLEYGVGTAMAWIMGGILIGFTAYQMKLLARAEFKAAG